MPISAVIGRREVIEAAWPKSTGEALHTSTFLGHPLACAAGLATLDLYRAECLFERVRSLEPQWAQRSMALQSLPGVLDIRTVGFATAIDLAPCAEFRQRAASIMRLGFEQENVLVRGVGNTVILAPPLVISENEMDELFDKLTRLILSCA